MQATKDAAENIRNSIVQNLACIGGVCDISPHDARIFFDITDSSSASWVDLSSASADQLSRLASACQPATFGRNQEDVLDETYRKAGKLDINQFATSFTPFSYHIVEHIRRGLLDASQQEKLLSAELYKLNVYGEGSFFKAHKDTPRGEGMIGSLVVVFSTPHEGGSLVLRHGGKEWTFDSGEMLKEKKSSVAYVAFFSDVEHEVTPVTSGFRITLTWNLYLRTGVIDSPTPPPAAGQSDLTATLTAAWQNLEFMPKGGYLGFGLDFQYPVKADVTDPTELPDILERLKGSDASLLRSLKLAGFKPRLKILYEHLFDSRYYKSDPSDDRGSGEEYQMEKYDDGYYDKALIMASREVDLSDRWEEEDLLLCFYNQGAKFTYDYGCKRPKGVKSDHSAAVLWITPPKSTSRFRTAFIAFGNQAELDYVYADLVLMAKVPPASKRGD